MGFENPVVGGTALRIPAIQSPNYVSGSSGWIIKIDGSAEFNNLTVRGQFSGTDFIINSAGIFLYSGAPALNNLIGSWASVAGTDGFGNTYQAGLTIYGTSTTINLLQDDITLTASNGTKAILESGTNAAMYLTPAGGPWFAGAIKSAVDASSHPLVNLFSPSDTINGVQSLLTLKGSSTASAVASVLCYPALTKQDVSGNAFTWQTPSLGTGWAIGPSGGTVQNCQYRLDAEDNLIIVGTVHSTSTTPAATIFNLPSGPPTYRPKVTQRCTGVSNSGGTPTVRYLEVSSNGNVSCNPNLTTTSTDVYFQVCVPLGNIS